MNFSKWNKYFKADKEMLYSHENKIFITIWFLIAIAINILLIAMSAYYVIYYSRINPSYNSIKSYTYIVLCIFLLIIGSFLYWSVKREKEKCFDICLDLFLLVGVVPSCLNFYSTGTPFFYIGLLIMVSLLVFSIERHIIGLSIYIIVFFAFEIVMTKDAKTIVRMDIIVTTVVMTIGLFLFIVQRTMKTLELRMINIQLEYTLRTDSLTDIGNRIAYEYELMRKENKSNEYVGIIFADLNNLKVVNDKYGHQAGDELIKGAAHALEKVVSPYGQIFRCGGDEFQGIIRTPIEPEKLQEAIRRELNDFKGMYVSKCEIAVGYADSNEFPQVGIKELVKKAEKRMYDDKTKYYRTNKIERRTVGRRT